MERVFDNDFRQWKITPEQISRIKNGEVQAMTEVFTDNYDHPIIECGVQLVDMVYLRKELNRRDERL